MTKLEAEIIVLKDALHHAQWTISFMHECLTNPGHAKYAYPDHTLKHLADMAKLAPLPKTCMHSGIKSDCPACVECQAERVKVLAAKAVLAGESLGKPQWTCPTCGGHEYAKPHAHYYACTGCSVMFMDPELFDHNHPGTPNDTNAGYKVGQC